MVKKQTTDIKKNKKNDTKESKKDNKKVKEEQVKQTKTKKEKKDKENKQSTTEEMNDPKILNDEEENKSLENMNALHENALKIVKENLIPHLDQNQIKSAVKAITDLIKQKYASSHNILANEQEEFLYLNFVLSHLPEKFSIRPMKIDVPNSIFGEKFNTNVCLIVKDPKSNFKELEINFPFKVKVLDINSLKVKYNRFEQRRNLLKQHEIFLCDYKIYFLLKRLLGKPFYTHKKFPVPIKLDYANKEEILKEVVNQVESSTHFYMSHGPNYTVRCARVVQEQSETIQNVIDAITNTLPHILKWGVDLK